MAILQALKAIASRGNKTLVVPAWGRFPQCRHVSSARSRPRRAAVVSPTWINPRGHVHDLCAKTALPLDRMLQSPLPSRPINSTASVHPGTFQRFPDSLSQAYLSREAVDKPGTPWVCRHRRGCELGLGKCNRFSRLSGSWLPCPAEGFGAFVAALASLV